MWQEIPYEAEGIYFLQHYVECIVLMTVICNISVQSDNNTVFKTRTHLKSLSGNKFSQILHFISPSYTMNLISY